MKVYRMVLCFIDTDEVGMTEAINHASPGTVMTIEARDIGEWNDDHPLNKYATRAAAFDKLFNGESPAPKTALRACVEEERYDAMRRRLAVTHEECDDALSLREVAALRACITAAEARARAAEALYDTLRTDLLAAYESEFGDDAMQDLIDKLDMAAGTPAVVALTETESGAERWQVRALVAERDALAARITAAITALTATR